MKSPLLLALSALLAFSLAHAAAPRPRSIEVVAVAERFADSTAARARADARPLRYAAVAAGYWEAGIPYAGEKVPARSTIEAELHAALAAAGYQAAADRDATAPDLLVTFHWGLLTQTASSASVLPTSRSQYALRIDHDVRARLSLVAPAAVVRQMEHDIILTMSSVTGINYIDAGGNLPTLERARDDRFFVIVSAYDYADFVRGELHAQWRVKLSARALSGSARAVLPTLAHGGAAFFGKVIARPQEVSAPLLDLKSDPPGRVRPPAASQAFVRVFKPGVLDQLLRQEYSQFSGEPLSNAPALYTETPSPDAGQPAANRPPAFAMSIYSRVTRAGARLPDTAADHPLHYIAFDAGPAELGHPLAGTAFPPPALVARLLRDALASRGYEPAAGSTAPDLALIFHWGYVRTLGSSDAGTAPAATPATPTDGYITPFVVVSAYDYADLAQNQKTLLWRAGLSADHANVIQALPALIQNSTPFLGRDFAQRQRLEISPVDTAPPAAGSLPPFPARTGPASTALRRLSENERSLLAAKLDLPVTPEDYLAHVPLEGPDERSLAADTPSGWHPDPSGRQLEIIARSAQTYRGTLISRPSPENPVYYVAHDAGYVQQGIPIRETPPASAPVARALASALAGENYRVADRRHRPSLLLVYRWGSRNLQATPDVDLAAGAVWSESTFVLSAYDYADFLRGEKTLLWRTALSAPQSDLRTDLPGLLLAGGRWFGRSLDQKQEARAPVVILEASDPVSESPFAPSPELARQVDTPLLKEIVAWERDARYARLEADRPVVSLPAVPASLAAGRVSERLILPSEDQSAGLPPELARRIAAYLKEKSAVQDTIAAKVRAQPPGSNPAQTVDEFTRANAARIAGLVQERDAIRGELSRFVSQHADTTGNAALDQILRAFAADVQQLGPPHVDG